MKSKFTTIKLKFDVSTIVFEHFEQIAETIIGHAETNSFAQLGKYRLFTVEKIPDESEPELGTTNSKKKIPKPTQPRKKESSNFQKGG